MARCEDLVAQGADILDIGGESTRPGARTPSVEEELARVLPVVRHAVTLRVPVSVDTSRPEVMQGALDAGADIVNDVRALQRPGALDVLARHPAAGVCLMHMKGEPSTMQSLAEYADVVVEVRAFLADRACVALARGVARERIVLDPGIGFAKTIDHNLTLLRCQRQLLVEGYPLLVGWSRKSTLGAVTGRAVEERLAASVAAALAAVASGRQHRAGARRGGYRGRAVGVARSGPDPFGGDSMTRMHFGTDGIRGTVGTEPITPDFMMRLGHAVGRVLKRSASRPTVLIGKDTRISGYMIESALEAGFASAGVDVRMTGPLPTPGVAYLTRALRLDLGVVISASHNAFPRQRGEVLLVERREAAGRVGAGGGGDAWRSRRSGSIPRAWARSGASKTPAGATSSSARARSATTSRSRA